MQIKWGIFASSMSYSNTLNGCYSTVCLNGISLNMALIKKQIW